MAIVTRHPIRTDVMNLREGEISISYPETITPDDYDDIAVWLALFQNRMRRLVQANPKPDPPPGDASGTSTK